MSNEEQNRAIAEALGWTLIRIHKEECVQMEWLVGLVPNERIELAVPHYATDLNAMHKAEKELLHAFDYEVQLKAIVKRDNHRPTDIHIWVWFATAAQRAEAFLRCKGLWKD